MLPPWLSSLTTDPAAGRRPVALLGLTAATVAGVGPAPARRPTTLAPTRSTAIAATGRGALDSARGASALIRGADTLGTEVSTRTGERLDATFRTRARGEFAYHAALRPDASVERITVTVRGPAGAVRTGAATFAGDSVTVAWQPARQDASTAAPADARADTLRRAVPRGAVPYLNPSPSLMEQVVRRARTLGGTPGGAPVLLPVVVLDGGAVRTATVTFVADSVQLGLAGVTVWLRTDPSGAILGGSVPGQGITLARTTGPRP